MNFLKNNFNKKDIFFISLITLGLTLLTQVYVILVERSSFLYGLSPMDALLSLQHFISIKQLLLFFFIFFIIVFLLYKSNIRKRTLYYCYNYRYVLAGIFLLLGVIFEIHGSSIAQLNLSTLEHNPIFGIVRTIKIDEFEVNTPFALSQYYNNFAYFSDIVRATTTDMFILYGQPVWDIAIIFNPFQWGYLFLPQGQGLSFYWCSRFILLFLVSFEMGLILTEKNKTIALAYAILVVLSPIVQWWYSVNCLVEMLFWAQLAIILINQYMTTNDYKRRLICALGMILCTGGYILAVYPAWQVPLFYIFLVLAIWIVRKNWSKFQFNKKDALLIALFVAITAILVCYVLLKSQDAILAQLNTVYPGLRRYYGGPDIYWRSADPYWVFDYMRNIFYPFSPNEIGARISLTYFISFFPMGIIFYSLITFVQKKKDFLLNLLIALYALFILYYLFTFPEIIGKITLMDKSMSLRFLLIITFLDLIIFIRSISIIGKIEFKFLSKFKNRVISDYSKFSLILSCLIVGSVLAIAFHGLGFKFYTTIMLIVAFIVFSITFYFILNIGNNKKYQIGFLISVIFISMCAGSLVNPVESGLDYYFEQPITQKIADIVEEDPNAIWVIEGHELYLGETIPVGARTLNSVNTYPNLDLWSKLDPNNESYEVWNRYALLKIVFKDSAPTIIEVPSDLGLQKSHYVVLILDTNDMKKLNITYILTYEDLSTLSNENVTFNRIDGDNGVNIYKVTYK
ncbi:hypothetical protein [Methanobrevibacter sp. DSM 116169]|uniref:DUF7657 domain-containing protein n=1 Tax=Methanobrevibacter sp. DSM 116169 TaxID=3242727 RepID=UPI0038FBED9C